MKRILKMSIFATSGMTLFSYVFSRMFNRKFLEPLLLNQLVFSNKKASSKNHPAGFVAHYAVGTFFSALYYIYWKKTVPDPKALSGSVMGFLNGLLGVSGWHLFFVLHPNPPAIENRKYYIHLVFAHMVFGYLNGLAFRKRCCVQDGHVLE